MLSSHVRKVVLINLLDKLADNDEGIGCPGCLREAKRAFLETFKAGDAVSCTLNTRQRATALRHGFYDCPVN